MPWRESNPRDIPAPSRAPANAFAFRRQRLVWWISRGISATVLAQATRNAVRISPGASVASVAFFDFGPAQTGLAPNAIALHPVLRFRCLSG